MRYLLALLAIPALARADGVPAPAPPPKTLAAATARCAKHDAKACVRAGDLYETAFFSRDSKSEYFDKSFAAYHKACDLDDLDGCRGVAWWYAENRDYKTSAAMLEPLCRGHDRIACAMLANQLENGEGVPEDVPRALKMYEETCAAATGGEGCLSGCNDLAFTYRYGRHNTREDAALSLHYYDRACELGCMNSCDTAGDQHREHEPATSAAQYQKACDAGFGPSCMSLSQLVKDPKKAKQLHDRACRVSDDQVSGCR